MGGTHNGLPVGWRNFPARRCLPVPGWNRHQRSAANRFVVFGSPHALEKSRAVMDGDDAMHPPLILFDYRTREFEPTRRSFDFIDVTALSVRRNDADVPSFVTNL
jgi:hypothetical protein